MDKARAFGQNGHEDVDEEGKHLLENTGDSKLLPARTASVGIALKGGTESYDCDAAGP